MLSSMGARVGGLARRLFLTPPGWGVLAGSAGGCYALQQEYGTGRDFFKHKFTTKKDPDAVVDFYSTEDFLQILGVFPIAIHFVLAGVNWDPKAENTMEVWNAMQISFDLTEKEEEIDGEDVVTFFNKRERFINYIPFTNIILWDQVQNYGYQRLPDGTLEVIHHGESFYGPWPARLLVTLHARYVIWATEKHINSPIFGNDDLEAQEHQRGNIPLHVFKQFVNELTEKQASLVKEGKLASRATQSEEETLIKLQKLQRMETTINVSQRGNAGSPRKLTIDDKAAQDAIRSALSDISKIEGSSAAREKLQGLLDNKEVEWTEKKKLPRKQSMAANVA